MASKKLASLTIPATVRGAAMYGAVFSVQDAERVVAATGIALCNAMDLAPFAAALDRLAVEFLLACEMADASSAGECARWARDLESRITGVFACFAQSADGSPPIDAADHVLRGPGGYIEVSGAAISPREDIVAALAALQALHRRVVPAAVQYEADKGAPRATPQGEMSFFRQLGDLYHRAFDASWTFSTDRDGQRTGPAIRFCNAVGQILGTTTPSGRGGGDIQAAIARLCHADRAADRIRDTRSGGPVRKR